MPPPDLLPELWAQVMSYLRRPLPPPTGRNMRSSTNVQQGDLSTAMRVSKLWNNLAAPHLYKTIVCDYLPALAKHRDSPAASANIKSKAELLGLTRRLALEYFDKAEPTYSSLLGYGGVLFALIHPGPKDLVSFAGAESDWIGEGIAALGGAVKVAYLSTGACFGGQKSFWQPIWDDETPGSDMPKRMTAARAAISALATASFQLAYFCQRVEYGPLTYVALWKLHGELPPPDWPGPKGFEHRIHIDSDPGEVNPIVNGHSIWYCPFKDVHTEQEIIAAADRLIRAATQQITGRERSRLQLGPARLAKQVGTAFLSIDCYLPSHFADPNIREYISGSIDMSRDHWLRELKVPKKHHSGDVFNFKEMKDAPRCQGCTWRIEDD